VRSETKVTAADHGRGEASRGGGRAGVGVDNIDVPAATARGVYVVNAPLGNIVAAAEHTLALALALLRRVVDGRPCVRAGEWTRSKVHRPRASSEDPRLLGIGASAARSRAAPAPSA